MAKSISNLIRDAEGIVTHRICSRCKLVVPINNFARDTKSQAGGYQRTCRSCCTLAMRERRAKGLVKKRTHAEKLEDLRRFRKLYPEKARAHALVAKAIRKGVVVRQLCHCGKKAEAHHDDYSKPLEVTWLCRQHHGELHRAKNEEAIPFIDWRYWGGANPSRVCKPNIKNTRRKISMDDAERLRERYALGTAQKDLAMEFGISRQSVNRIVHGLRYNPKKSVDIHEVSFNPEEMGASGGGSGALA